MALRPDFVISDSHYLHQNIVKYCNRPFDHDWLQLKRWRTAVKDTDTVLHLGDLFFGRRTGPTRFAAEIAPKLTGQKYLLLGNHDKRSIDYEALGFTVLEPYSIEYKDFTVSFDHYLKVISDDRHLRVHGHIHNNPYPDGQEHWPNNINVSVEVIDYTPQRLTRLLNAAILGRKKGDLYLNSKGFRNSQNRRATL